MIDEDAQREAYENSCRLLMTQLFLWRISHPDARLLFQWNFPHNIVPAVALCDAITTHLVTVNDAAKNMLAELGWDTDSIGAPSLMQVKTVLECLYGSPDQTEQTSETTR